MHPTAGCQRKQSGALAELVALCEFVAFCVNGNWWLGSQSGRRRRRRLPGVSEQTPDTPGGAGWSVDGTELYVVTFGSSSCPTVANEITVVEGASLAVELIETGGAVCTADYSPTTSTVAVPDGIDNAVPQVLTIGELGEVTVPPATGGVVVAWRPLQNP